MSDERLAGRVWKFGDNVSGDNGIIEFSIIRDFTKPFDEAALAAMCFKRIVPEFPSQVRPGDLVVGGRNFAHHNHPQVGVAIKASGVRAVIAESTDSSFVRKSLNIGLPVVHCPGITGLVEQWQELALDLARGEVRNVATGRSLRMRPYSERMLAIWRAGGLINHMEAELARARAAAE